MYSRVFYFLIINALFHSSVSTFHNFPSFRWIQQLKNKGNKENFKHETGESKKQNELAKPELKPHHSEGQGLEEFYSRPSHEKQKGQEVEKINFGSKPEHHKGQEVEEFPFGPSHEEQKGQEVEEINFGSKPEHHKGQEIEEINFGSKPEHHKGQEIEEFPFGPSHEEQKGQEVEEINFGSKPEHHKGQEVEEFPFGPSHEAQKGQEVEEINFGSKPEHHKGQEAEEFPFGPSHEEQKGQEVEEINFGSKTEHHKGQEIEEFPFGPSHEEQKGQEVEEINFGSKPEHHKGQEIEEFPFGPSHEEQKGQEVEEIHFGSKPEHHKGQEIEEFPFGPSHEEQKGQEVEEINFGSKPIPEKENNFLLENISKKNESTTNKEQAESLHVYVEHDCLEEPEVPANAVLLKISDKRAEISCESGYKFSDESKTIILECVEQKWISSVDIWPKCSPVCEPPCQNDGICVLPNQCSCLKNFEGPQCQFGQKPCSNHPPVPMNALINCNSSNCIVKCFDSYTFPDGSVEVDLICHQEQWVLTRSDWSFLPDCKPSCHPPCVNGGSCLDLNTCQCPEKYVGPQCQYELSACDAKKLNFNGYYTCKGESDKVSCTLSCPEGHESDAPLAKEYICYYSSAQFTPQPVPKCLFDENVEVIKFGSSSHIIHEGFNGFESSQVPNYPSTAECLSWKKLHYKNFDGRVFSFDGSCSYVLAEDTVENTFRIVTENFNRDSSSFRFIKVYYQDQEYKIHYDGKIPLITVGNIDMIIPNRSAEFSVEQLGDQILVSLTAIEVTLNWNSEDHLSITVNKNMINKTGGLCGNFNYNPNDDFLTPDRSVAWNLEIFVQSWVDDAYNCDSRAVVLSNCTNNEGEEYCKKFFTDVHFEKCYNAGIFKTYLEACIWDVCNCGEKCACETIFEFVKTCKNYLLSSGDLDSTSEWRQIANCPFNCPPGKIYTLCGPSIQTTCGSFEAEFDVGKYSECVEGCFCPNGLLHYNDTCIEKKYCPCKWRNKFYNKGEKITKDCNTCTCQNGEWECTSLKCPARCSVTGNSHYLTFDGKRYEFQSQCSYYLLKSKLYSIVSEDLPCDSVFLTQIFHNQLPQNLLCSKLITIKHESDEIKLKRNKEVLVNGVEQLSFPIEVNGAIIRMMSHYVIVKLPDNTEIWWDGNTNVYVELPGNHIQPEGGLCGTPNNNQKDDFKTPEGDIELIPHSFAEKWKADETCNEISDIQKPRPCDSNINLKEIAEKKCQKLKENAFKECHPHVDVEPFYRNCLDDVCSCQKEIKDCICPIFSDYAKECARHNTELFWRNEIRECGLHCPQGQTYQPCGDSCAISCLDISTMNGNCEKKCAEGCSCPEGLVLDSVGRCIPISKCPCYHKNFKYKPSHEVIMENQNGAQFCTCQNALWSCRPATKLEIDRDYENSDYKCNETAYEEYTTCVPAEPKTCKNMHEKSKHSTRICFPGCVCKKGFVWDSIGKVCVNASECPCHHGGRSYNDGEKIQQDCNSCVCKNGVWSCTERECSSICSTWGDTHFKTFDGNLYDFQGSCDFVFASGAITKYETFLINIEIVPCGSAGISCPKSISLLVGSFPKEEKVVFKNYTLSQISGDLERISVREVGFFIIAEVFDLGITVKWDRGTRVYVKADSRWKNRVKGLCGNFNDNELDDFKTPSSGETNEVSPVLFADSWRLQPYCPESSIRADTCARLPHRKPWAVKKCSLLNSEIFERCHSEVSLEPFLERCISDTCGCDEGGDCDCMCTAIAAYAEECSLRGVPIKWRSQQLCPLQCDENLTYKPCISTCPPKSCENQFQHSALLQTCAEEPCVEGCDKPHCPPGEVYADSFSNRCVPIKSCKTVCLTVNNVTYLEGDLMESDDCHSCYCSHHKKVCTGEKCHEITSTLPSPVTTAACPKGQVWDDCIAKCDHVCNHIIKSLKSDSVCSDNNDCVPGCRDIKLKCSPDLFLRDKHTCVQKMDCPCRSLSGLFLKPGDIINESECEKCQCINNEYECINVCTVPPLTEESFNYTKKRYTYTTAWDFVQEGNVTLIYHTTTVVPPVLCPNGLYGTLMDTFTRLSASSHLDELSSPVYGGVLSTGKFYCSWVAGIDNADQYLQVDLGRIEPIYAVNVYKTSDNFVSSYHLLHSLNGEKFVVVIDQDGQKKVFEGPTGGQSSATQEFPIPIEARYIRFHPVSWHGHISMKVDVLGCKNLTKPIPVPSVCDKPIGIGQKRFPKLHITATSSKPNNGPNFIGFDNERGWQPLTNSDSEFVQLDFSSFGNFTGLTTKGVSQGNELFSSTEESWVEKYKVQFSQDGFSWNIIPDEFGNEMIFAGNTDSETEKKNYFNAPIEAKMLKVIPVKWHKNIALRLDVMGCYESPRLEVEITPPVTPPTIECKVCPGVFLDKNHCQCPNNEWWDGENCVNHFECPCFVGLIPYPVGTTFTTEKCEECVCKLNGRPHCSPKICPECSNGLQKILTPLCGCTCKQCEEHTRLCPTSNTCLHESKWCNGVQDCPDDEINCTTPTTKGPPPAPCTVSCPPGYSVVYRNKTAGPAENENLFQNRKIKSVKSKKSVKTYTKTKKIKKSHKLTECPPYDCVPAEEVTPTACSPPECPLDYSIVYKKHEDSEESCPLYACEPIPEYANCTILSKNIKTYDGLEYKFEICDHIITKHGSGLWNVSMVKDCPYGSICTTILIIKHKDHVVEFYSNTGLVKVDSFPYTEDQVELLKSKMTDFTLNPLGNSIVFISEIYGFEIVFDINGNLQIKVPGHMKGHIAGLCGFYSGVISDDKTNADGKLSKTVSDFGDSWSNSEGKKCVETACPIDIQRTALEICRLLMGSPFNSCLENVNLEHCIESACDCMTNNRTVDECRCQVLSDFAAKCKNPSLLGWRVEHDCPSSCPPNLVHYDCYPYACQPTCGNEECTEPATNCYSGCFCPDGLVKKGDQCIKLQNCRDCVCSGMESTYLTFDGALTFNGNCTYVATREKNPSGTPNFEILISNSLCNGSDFMTCTDKVTIKVPGHEMKIVALPNTEEMVMILVDGHKEDVQKTETLDKVWSKIIFNPESSLIDVELPWEHVDVRYFYKRFAFTISLPSHYYSDKVEGLCGTCSQRMIDPEEMDNPEEWQTEKDKNCLIEPPISCVPTPEHQKICDLMNDPDTFGPCLTFVDPTPFIDQCLTMACINGHVCSSLEAYGQACRDGGVCVNWRNDGLCPFTCPSDLEYQACSSGCQKTCDNYDEVSSLCTSGVIEGCFCPDSQILINGTCKPEKYCEYCDEDGQHYEDDVWQVNECTNCTCKNHVVTCDKTECPESDIKCEDDHYLIKEKTDFECCPKYKCECKPREECEKVELPTHLPLGMEAVLDETGCCPRVELVCRLENCPKIKPCKEFYEQKIINTTECCPEYFCEKPSNLCIYEFSHTSHEGQTRVQREGKLEVMKEVGERWSDGPCKSCICVEKDGYSEAVCTVTECPNLKEHPDYSEYDLEQIYNPEKCCPEVIRKSCKYNGTVYKVGDTWIPNENNPCETMKCNEWNAQIIKETRLEVCNTNCELGWEYKKSEDDCCGHCVQIGCLVGDKLYKEGEIWYTLNKCSKSTCEKYQGRFMVTTETKKCPSIENCPPEDIYEEDCCLKCKIQTSDKTVCFPQPIPLESTIKLVKQRKGKHGDCYNMHPIHNFTQCVGNCDSYTKFKPETMEHESVCKCCKPEEYSLITVELKCQDGKDITKTLTVPSKCSCMFCGS